MEKSTLKQIKQYQKLRSKAQEKGNLKEEAESLNFLGELHTKIGEHDEALNLHKEELAICLASEDKIGQAVANRKIGECYVSLENFTKALQHQYKHLEIGKVAENLPEQQRAYATIGRTYLIQGEDLHNAGNLIEAKIHLKKAKSVLESSIRLSQSLQESKLLPEKEINLMKARSITNLAFVYHMISLSENEGHDGPLAKQSLAFYKRALTISQKHMLSDETHRANIQLTLYYRSRGLLSDALHYADEANRCAKVASNKQWRLEALGELASINLLNGNCEASRKMLKKAYRLSESVEMKENIIQKLKSAVWFLHLQSKASSAADEERFKLYEKIADKFCDLECFKAAIEYYKKQEELFEDIEGLTYKQKASVYYSLALTHSDMNDHETAIEYYRREMECYTEPKELAKTWSQVGICVEKLGKDLSEAESCYRSAVEYAEKTEDSKLQLKALNLLLDLQEKQKSLEVTETRSKISEIQLKSGILALDGEEDSEEMVARQSQEVNDERATGCDFEDEDVDQLVEKELKVVSSDDSDAEENRKSRVNTKIWKRKQNEKGETPLHTACIDGHMKRVQLLLEQGHPINEPDNAGWSPLHEACIHGFTEIVRVLLDHGANVNFTAHCGTTPMQDAASNGHFEIISILLERGASADMRNKKGETALHCLENYFFRERDNLDAYETEIYWKTHKSLQESGTVGTNKENTHPDSNFTDKLSTMNDLFDPEMPSQRSCTGNWGETQNPDLGILEKSKKRQNDTLSTQNFDPYDEIFNDSQILPSFESRPRVSKLPTQDSARESLLGGNEESLSNVANEYRDVMARLGGSDSISKIGKTVRAPKRPLNDDLGGLVNDDEYVGDDWLIDDTEDMTSSSVSSTRPSKRSKTVGLSAVDRLKSVNNVWKTTNSTKDSNSGAFTSSFLNRSNIRAKNLPKKLISTKIKDFLPTATDDDIIIEDDDEPKRTPIVSSNNFSQPRAPSSSFAPVSTVLTQSTSQNPVMRIKVKINEKMFLIAIPGSTKTIGWLCERASLVYKQNTGLQPKLALYAGATGNEEEACLLSNDDLVGDVLQSNEHVTAKIVSWETTPLPQKYEEACIQNKQVAIHSILSACHDCSTSGRIDLKNQGLLTKQLIPLVSNLTQQEITSVLLPGNDLRDEGVGCLCESFQRQMTLSSPSGCSLLELNLRCVNLTLQGLKKLTQAAEKGVFKELQMLDLSYNRLGDFCCEDLTKLLKSCGNLKKLSLSNCRFTNKLFQSNYPSFRTALKGCISLTNVDFSRNLFGSVGAELLLKSLPCTSVMTLDISQICDDSNNSLLIRHMLSYLKQEDCQMQTLHMASNSFNAQQLSEFIRDLKDITDSSLRSVNISKNNINSQAEARLSTLFSDVGYIEDISINAGHHKWKRNRDSVWFKQREMTNDDFGIVRSQTDVFPI